MAVAVITSDGIHGTCQDDACPLEPVVGLMSAPPSSMTVRRAHARPTPELADDLGDGVELGAGPQADLPAAPVRSVKPAPISVSAVAGDTSSTNTALRS
jgi:hypothetical protein